MGRNSLFSALGRGSIKVTPWPPTSSFFAWNGYRVTSKRMSEKASGSPSRCLEGVPISLTSFFADDLMLFVEVITLVCLFYRKKCLEILLATFLMA